MSTVGDLSPENTIQGGTDSTLIGNDGDKLKVYSKTDLVQQLQMMSLLYDIKEELKKMNVHLAHITDLEVEAED